MFINLRLISIAVVASIVASAHCELKEFPEGEHLHTIYSNRKIDDFRGQEESAFDKHGYLQKADVDDETLEKRQETLKLREIERQKARKLRERSAIRDGGKSVRRSADEVNPVVIPEGLEHLK